MQEQFDVIVVGAGNAALAAALAAHAAGAKVCVLERANASERGGNTYVAGGGYRFTYKDINDIKELMPDLSPAELSSIEVAGYSADEYFADMNRITQNLCNPELLEILVQNSHPTMKWLTSQGLKWELRTEGADRIGGRVRWSRGAGAYMPLMGKGGGAGRSDQYFEIVQQRGIRIEYGSRGLKLITDSKGKVCGITVRGKDGLRDINCKNLVLACGGFEANPEMRVRYLGSTWDLVRVKGTKYNTGDGLRMALEAGAAPVGHWSCCHCNPVSADMPPYGLRSMLYNYNRMSYPYGLMVNVNAKRFVDEGEDYYAYTYATFGRVILTQPEQTAFQIFDAKTKPYLDSHYATGGCVTADSIEQLADRLGLDVDTLCQTVADYNRAVQDGGSQPFLPRTKDGRHTLGITPPKSNWAIKLDSPPFVAYGVAPGITFTYGGIKVNKNAQVVDVDNEPIAGLYAAGEMIGGIYYHGYCGGSGLMAGAVFGKIAGTCAAA